MQEEDEDGNIIKGDERRNVMICNYKFTWDKEAYNHKKVVNKSGKDWYPGKWRREWMPIGYKDPNVTDVNFCYLRYADVVLMAAEAANEKNIPGEAIDYLEMVRARARGSNTNILPKVTTTDQGELREAIRHERRVELGLEFDRFYDLVRWGIAADVLHAAGKVNYQAKNALLPLPQSEIDKSKGVLVQNPDY